MPDRELEALCEKESAEGLIVKKEYQEAMNRLLKAQQSFPGLEQIDAMITVCDILSADTDRTPSSEIDYYWVLQVGSSSPLSSINVRYQKLLARLQPIKNKFIGTKLALKLIDDAFNVLRDEVKRLAYDSRRNNSLAALESFYLRKLHCQRTPCQDTEAAQPEGIASIRVSRLMHDSITKIEGHVAEDINKDVDVISQPDQEVIDQDFYAFDNDRTLDKIEPGQIWAVHFRSNKVQNYRYARIVANANSAVSVIWLKPVPVSDEGRRWYGAGLPVVCGSFCLDKEMGEQILSPEVFLYKSSWVPRETCFQFDIYPKMGEVWALYEDCKLDELLCNPEIIKSCKFKLVEFLSHFSKHMGAETACLQKVDGFRSIFRRQNREGSSIHFSPRSLYRLSQNVPAYRFTRGEIIGVVAGMLELDLSALPYSLISDTCNNPRIMEEENAESSSSFNFAENSLMSSCLDSKVLPVIAAGQVWAVYCGGDSMPRRYVLIDNVISTTQVSVTFLELQPIVDNEINWKNEELPVVCGTFRVGGRSMNLGMSQLSYPVDYQKKNMPLYTIYPSKGEVWAVYRKWNKDWKHSDYENCQYCVCEILSNFSEGEKIMVARLREVKGCSTFFYKQQFDGFDLVHTISSTEIPSFSHQIPSFQVNGIGYHGIQEGFWHLEPNALPLKITFPSYDILDQ